MLRRYWLIIASSVIIVALAVLAAVYLRIYSREDVITSVSGAVHMDFRVFYLENELYDENTVSRKSHFYMSFTDFIELTGNFSLNLGSETEVYWRYTATERLIVRYAGTANPIMFEESRTLSEESGSGDIINIPGNTYRIDPHIQIERYRAITADTLRQINERGLDGLGFRGLSAYLLLDFAYTIHIPSLGIARSLTSGYHLPLNMEVFAPVITGSQSFTESVILIAHEPPFEITMPVIIAFAAAMLMSAYCLFTGIKRLQTEPDERRSESKTILKKYDNEIVISSIPLPLSAYTLIPVGDFKELLKLAINQNEHIMCYHDSKSAEFAVVVKERAYYYSIKFNKRRTRRKYATQEKEPSGV